MTSTALRGSLVLLVGAVILCCGRAEAAFPPRHLYVADLIGGTIERYPLLDGLPSTLPDETFARVPSVEFLGVDGAGNIYAAPGPFSNDVAFVQAFAPNGTSIGELSFGGDRIWAFATDSDGYMYIVFLSNLQRVLVYDRRALTSAAFPKPIAVLSSSDGNNFVALATDAHRRLYGAMLFEMDVFDHPRVTSKPSFSFVPPSLPNVAWYGGAVAFDEHARMYANMAWRDYCEGHGCKGQRWYNADFDTITHWRTLRRTDSMTYTRECPSHGSGGAVTGMAVFGGYIDAACSGSYPSVLRVYRSDAFGHQGAVETLGGVQFPTDAKVGP